MRRPRIKRTTESVTAPDGTVYLMRPVAGYDIRIESPSPEQLHLLKALDGSHTVEQLEQRFDGQEVATTLSQFQDLEIVEDAADDDHIPPEELSRFDRQLRYFSDIGSPSLPPSEAQRRLREAKVAVLGVGGLGGGAAIWLASVGIGEMWLVDGDRIEPSNLNRQVLYNEAEIGLLKAEMAAARLRAFNPAMRITSIARRLQNEDEIAEFVSGSDIVIDAADWPAHDIERWCNSVCFGLRIPYITMSHFPPVARVGPLYVPEKTGCFACQEIAYRREFPMFDLVSEQRRAKPSPTATLGPACGMIGAQVALEVMHFLTRLADPSTLGVAQIFDLRTMEIEREQVIPEANCPVCGHLDHEEAGAGEAPNA